MKILLVTNTASIHAARWVNQFKGLDWEIHVYQAIASENAVNVAFKHGTLHLPYPEGGPEGIIIEKTLPFGRRSIYRLCTRVAPGLVQTLHEWSLAIFIRKQKPDIIHSLGLNINWKNNCMPVYRVRQKLRGFTNPPWIYSTWGTDLDFYAKMSAKNRFDVGKVLRDCDFLITECQRDLRLATQMGFHGRFLGFFTGFGGFSLHKLLPAELLGFVGKRKTILIKGRDISGGDPIGRAMTAYKALGLCAEKVQEFSIFVIDGTPSQTIDKEIALLAATKGLNIGKLPFLPYETVLEIYRSARVFISLTINDGIPGSLVEAMALGAFPIHSDLESIRELITDGENGFLVPANEPSKVAAAIEKAVGDDFLVENAARINGDIIRYKYSDAVTKPRVLEMYRSVVSHIAS